MNRITEQDSEYRNLEKKSISEVLFLLNEENKKVPSAIEKRLKELEQLVSIIVQKLKNGGRLFYVGAGSGGRLSVLDVIELPTTFGVLPGLFNVILAGGEENLHLALEGKEDDTAEGWKKLLERQIKNKDIVIGISASGTTPFVLETLKKCCENGITTGCIVSNPNSPIASFSNYVVEIITGPEPLTGSTRMKCGSVQKMVFDMISTTVMIQLGRVQDNHMVNMKLLNKKMIDRSVRMILDKSSIKNYDEAKSILLETGSVQKALSIINKK